LETTNINEGPFLLDTGKDSSFQTVQYKSKLLYSKYNPQKSIISLIQKEVFLPGTIILICSPCLWYGYTELISRLNKDCTCIAVEKDYNLFSLAQKHNTKPESFVPLYTETNLLDLDLLIRKLCKTGKYKRIKRLDFSAGTNLYPEFYNFVINGLQDIVSTFWKNRITLSKMGKLYSKNLIKNLPLLSRTKQLIDFQNKITKPILVCGAGESLNSISNIINNTTPYIISVDVALQPLLQRNIIPDAVVAVEGQFSIQKSYIGTQNLDITLFADLCSRIEIPDFFINNTVFFSSNYTDDSFFSDLVSRKIIKSTIPSLGSVGLYAMYIALILRKDSSIPVYFTGLDFSYSCGLTHAKGTAAHRAQVYNNNRLVSIENYNASFINTIKLIGKDSRIMYTSAVMKSYAESFCQFFNKQKNIIDLGVSGINLGFENKKYIQNFDNSDTNSSISNYDCFSYTDKKQIIEYLQEKIDLLLRLKDLLIHGEKSIYLNRSISLESQIIEILKETSFLYIHFPDGFEPSTDLSFLKRMRAEIDIFLKTFNFALNRLK